MKPDELFHRLVTAGKGFGSYCFGQNNLFLGVLRGLKYRCAAIDVLSSSKITYEYNYLGRMHVAPESTPHLRKIGGCPFFHP